MRTMVFFDLPNVYLRDKKNYIKFRKYLINEGFIMMQESVYSKIALNSQQSGLLINRIRKNAPKKGIIQVMTITEKQYSQIEYIIGETQNKIIDTEDKLIVL
ncbi:MAG TPA: CRISPR-associated endonuclease Cas2 [Candidatus Pelethosoma merdigallinarum]|nr:CRISPR-associated endonuclease Cas2 [Candidatus Pelethosoma merdigallinarum]